MDRKLVNRLFIVAALLILLVSSLAAGQRFLGDIYGERVALSLDFWGRKRISPDLQMLDQHIDFISQARSFSPSSARYMELEARLRLMRLLDIPLANVPGQLEEILSLHKAALEYRPNWPFSWANVVLIKGMLHQLDEEFDLALNNVMVYGPYELALLRRVITTGIRNWDELSTDSRELIYQAVANSAELSTGVARATRNQLNEEGILDEFCAQLQFHSEQGRSLVCG